MTRSALGLGLALALLAPAVSAATFDAAGYLVAAKDAVVVHSLESEAEVECADGCSFELMASDAELALAGTHWARFTAQQGVLEVPLELPAATGSYRASAWLRHARVWARVVLEHEGSERGTEVAYLFPSGRVTSDGWVELVSNPFSVTGAELTRATLRLSGTDADLDAIEVVPNGKYDAGHACSGAFDPVCGPEALCIGERCQQGARFVPPLPPASVKKSVAEYLMARVQLFFGGKRSRADYMPAALSEMQKMLAAETPWQYWSAFAQGVRLLDDWHTGFRSGLDSVGSARRLGVCFIEGDADLTQTVWPSQAGWADVLVSHVGPDDNTLGLLPGDRLVAVDGMHPLEWARSLRSVNFRDHSATDPDVDAEYAEGLASLIASFAKVISVIRCDPSGPSCSSTIETIPVTDLPVSGSRPSCDNRPFYHLKNPPEGSPGSITQQHHVPFVPWREEVVDSLPGESIYGMTFDNLYGTSQGLTPYFKESNQFFKDNARGVILDHRAGNGGTLDAPEAITELVRAPFDLAVGPTFITVAGDDGPKNASEGLARFESLSKYPSQVYQVGSDSYDASLPVALIIHRDGSASDYLPLGMKGAPNVRIFGPHQTAGAFSSFYEFSYWSRIGFQLASGDTITFEGETLIGKGVLPDVIVQHTQTSLLAGQDAPYDAALAWVRGNLK
jgi:hypothetical protein